jgi:hypothetical protein
MRIYVSALIQHSIFSSGYHTASLHIATSLAELGHDVSLVNIAGNKATWFDDCGRGKLHVLQKEEFIGPAASLDCIGGVIKGDLLIDVIGSLSAEDRAAIARRTVLFIRHPPAFTEIECATYPMNTIRRCYDGISEIWSWDFYKQDDFTLLGLLGRCKVRAVPFIWTPRFLDAFCEENAIAPWHAVAGQGSGWICRIAETNASNRSNCTIPLVTLRHLTKEAGVPLQQILVHNASDLAGRAFFKENVIKHTVTTPEAVFIGRNRVCEWTMQPRSFLLAHCRFTPVRPLYLDAAYMGIPLIHNSPLMKQFGAEFESYYYADNSITGATAATQRLFADYAADAGAFAGRLTRVRGIMTQALNIKRGGCVEAWTAALNEAASATEIVAAMPVKAPVATQTYIPKETFNVQFVGMWDQFQVNYNFFTVLLNAYFKAQGRIVNITGHDSKYAGDLNLRIMGPFPCTDAIRGGIPTVFTTAENVGPLPSDILERNNIKLQLGFSRATIKDYIRLPLWMMSINWFGADNDRLVNPRLIPLKSLTESQGSGVRPKFCSFVVTNPNNPVRNAALDLMERIDHVDSAGRYRNNCGDALFAGLGGGGGEEKKVAWLRNYRFSITYENSLGDGYVTEKLFHAKAAGCVPIYWGDAEAAAIDFDAGGYLVANGKTDEQLLAEVRQLEADPVALAAVASRPLLTPAHVESVRHRLAEVATALVRIGGFEVGPAVSALGFEGVKPAEKMTVRENYGRSYA